MELMDKLLFLSADELISYGISRSTIANGVSRFRNHLTLNWFHLGEKEGTKYFKDPLISYDSIPVHSRKKLPTKKELIKKFISEKKEEVKLLTEANKFQSTMIL